MFNEIEKKTEISQSQHHKNLAISSSVVKEENSKQADFILRSN